MFTSTATATELIVEENDWIPHCYTSPAVYSVIFYIILVSFAVFNMMLSIYNLYNLRHEKTKYIGICILFIIINIFFGFSGIAYSIHLAFGFVCISLDPHLWDSMGLTGLNFYIDGLACLQLLYLLRLWMICNDVKLLTLSIIVIIICIIAFILEIAMTPFITFYFVILQWSEAIMFMTIFTFLNSIFSVYLLYLFWSKIYGLGQSVQSQQIHDKIAILSPAIRYAICAFTSIISTQIVNFVSIYRAYIKDDEFWWSLHLTLIVFDQTINILCVWLQSAFGKQYYFKYLSNIHSFCETKLLTKMSPNHRIDIKHNKMGNRIHTMSTYTCNIYKSSGKSSDKTGNSVTTTTSQNESTTSYPTHLPKLYKSVTSIESLS